MWAIFHLTGFDLVLKSQARLSRANAAHAWSVSGCAWIHSWTHGGETLWMRMNMRLHGGLFLVTRCIWEGRGGGELSKRVQQAQNQDVSLQDRVYRQG